MQDFFRLYSGYILAMIVLIGGAIDKLANRKQRKVQLEETEINVRKGEIEAANTLIENLKDTAEEWRLKFVEEKATNAELIKANKLCIDNIVKEQEDKVSYVKEIHQLRIEVAELRNMILKFQAQFPELFKNQIIKS